MKTNRAVEIKAFTHEGGRANAFQKPEQELERAVLNCLLFENTFYESGNEITGRIAELCKKVTPEFLTNLAVKARNDFKLRHVPLFLAVQLVRLENSGKYVRSCLANILKRPDEITEYLNLYWEKNNGKKTLTNQMKLGIADALNSFDEYRLSKWNRGGKVKLRDALFLVHPKAKNLDQQKLFDKLVKDELAIPDTWEVALSSGADKKDTWNRLLTESKLGDMATIMNLRNMLEAGADPILMANRLGKIGANSKLLPFRFLTAAKHAPSMVQDLNDAMLRSVEGFERLSGSTAIVVDVSESMNASISSESTTMRYDAACGVAILAREICERVRIFAFSDNLVEIGNYRGIALQNGIVKSQPNNGTYLAKALEAVKNTGTYDRVIVITDEQSHDGTISLFASKGYIVNVAPYKPSLETGKWVRINGWSERLIEWIRLYEASENSVEN